MTKTIAYLRVSTDKQADKGVSLEAQRAKVAAYAELYDLEIVDVIVDAGVSAKTLDRPRAGACARRPQVRQGRCAPRGEAGPSNAFGARPRHLG